MAFYKQIFNLPFRNFTFSDLACWKKIYLVEKSNNFIGASFESLVQIVYYELAIENYEYANFFINLCLKETKQDLSQIKFLEPLVYCLCKVFSGNHYSSGWKYYLLDQHYENIFELALKKYDPALLFICDMHIRGPTIQSNILIDFLEKLTEIEKNLIEKNVDNYYLHNYKKNIKIFLERVYPTIRVDTSSNNIDVIDVVVKLAIDGSELATIKALEFSKNGYGYYDTFKIRARMRCRSVKKYRNEMQRREILFNKISVISSKFFRNKIQQPLRDYDAIVDLLRMYRTSAYAHSQHALIKEYPLKLVEECLTTLASYLMDGCDNLGITLAYLDFFANTDLVWDPQHDLLCRRLLLKCYENGILFLLCADNGLIVCFNKIYQKWPVEQYEEIVIKSCVPVMIELMLNHFWIQFPNKLNTPREVLKRLFYFRTLLKMNPIWWKVCLCTLGINVLDGQLCVTQDLLLKEIFDYFPENCSMARRRAFYENLKIVISSVMCDFRTMAQSYKNLFQRNENMDILDQMQKKYEDDITEIVESPKEGFSIKYVLDYVLDIAKFSQKYIKLINLHERYKPYGEYYFDIEAAFNKRVRELV